MRENQDSGDTKKSANFLLYLHLSTVRIKKKNVSRMNGK